RHDLDAIVHPAVYRAIGAGLRAFELVGGARLALVDIPLLYETGHASDFNRVIATVCPPDLQVKRLIYRGINRREAQQRLDAQMPARGRAARADCVSRTDGYVEEFKRKVE